MVLAEQEALSRPSAGMAGLGARSRAGKPRSLPTCQLWLLKKVSSEGSSTSAVSRRPTNAARRPRCGSSASLVSGCGPTCTGAGRRGAACGQQASQAKPRQAKNSSSVPAFAECSPGARRVQPQFESAEAATGLSNQSSHAGCTGHSPEQGKPQAGEQEGADREERGGRETRSAPHQQVVHHSLDTAPQVPHLLIIVEEQGAAAAAAADACSAARPARRCRGRRVLQPPALQLLKKGLGRGGQLGDAGGILDLLGGSGRGWWSARVLPAALQTCASSLWSSPPSTKAALA